MPRFYGKRIMLREFRTDDIKGMRQYVNDEETTRHLSGIFRLPHTYDQTRGYLDGILRGDAGGVHLVIADIQSEEYLGQCDLISVDHVARHAELAIVILPGNTKKGIGREAISLLLEFAFLQYNLNKVMLRVHEDNLTAIRCYEACGFVHEGRMRKHHFAQGKYTDILMMSILKEEWEAGSGKKTAVL